MLKNYLKFLKSEAGKFKDKDIFDILVYGSSVKSKEEPRDVDLLIVFKDKKLRERLEIAQKFKKQLKKKIKNLDIKTINLLELFDSNFLPREHIFIEGFSLLHNVYFSERIGFKGYFIFTYSLKNLNHNEKTKFTYALIGRKEKGMIEKVNAVMLGKGAVMVPAENFFIFEEFLNKWNVEYKIKKALIVE